MRCSKLDTHTHNRLDQRFAVIAKLLARASSLETPADYISFLQEHYKPARNVKLVVEEVGGAHHWRMFFDHLATHFAGMTGTQSTADAAHLFRIVRRDSVKSCVPGIPFEEDGQGQPSDPVLLAKHWICSKALSQPPTVLLEGDLGLDFSKLPGMTAPRTMLTDFSVKQYKRTALEVLAAPWQLEAASAYLMSWLRRNAGQAEQPLPLLLGKILHPMGPFQSKLSTGSRRLLPCGGLQLLVLCRSWLMSVAGPKLPAIWLRSSLPHFVRRMVRSSMVRSSMRLSFLQPRRRKRYPRPMATALRMKLLQTHLRLSFNMNPVLCLSRAALP